MDWPHWGCPSRPHTCICIFFVVVGPVLSPEVSLLGLPQVEPLAVMGRKVEPAFTVGHALPTLLTWHLCLTELSDMAFLL